MVFALDGLGVVLARTRIGITRILVVASQARLCEGAFRASVLGVALVLVFALKILVVIGAWARVSLGQVNKVWFRSLPGAFLETLNSSVVLFNARFFLVSAWSRFLAARPLQMFGHFQSSVFLVDRGTRLNAERVLWRH